jgi:membrane protein YdbS with pleckstrin-like domain
MYSYPLSAKKPLVKTIKEVLKLEGLIIFLSIVGFIFLNVITDVRYVFGLLFVIFAIISSLVWFAMYEYQKHYYKTYFYNITDKFIIIRKGVLAPREITVPFDRIQDVYLDQDIIDRWFNVYDVHMSTATMESAVRAHIDGVEKHTAEQLRELILQKMHEARK